jgi:hypothetical protein
MKKLLSTLGFIIFVTSTLISQTLVQKWNTIIPLGTYGVVTKIVHDSIFTYTLGREEIGGNSHSALTKINDVTGDTVWIKKDSVTLSSSDLQFCVLNSKVYYVSSTSTYSYLITRDKNSGEMIQIKTLASRISLTKSSNGMIGITRTASANVVVFNQNGDSVRSFPLGYSLSNGSLTINEKNGFLWIFGLYYSSGYSSFVEKRNIVSGQMLWRQNFVGSNPFYGSTDSIGNSYNSIYYSNGVDSLVKIDPNGNRVWAKPYTQDVYPRDVAVNTKQNIVLTVGVTQSNGDKGIVVGRNATTGDSVFSFIIAWNQNFTASGVTGICCDNDGNFYLTGYGYPASVHTTCYTRKYFYDTLTGITVIGNENPQGFKLSQNYPNPFNPMTKIRFDVANGFPVGTSGNDKVMLKIYDIQGRELQTLVNESLKPGTYEVNFDGSKLTSGVYFYKLITDSYSETKKMLMIK